MADNKRVGVYSRQIPHYRTASAMRLLSFLRSVDRRPIRYDGSRPLQKTVPTELSNNNLLSSAAALPRARHTSFMIWGERGGDACYVKKTKKQIKYRYWILRVRLDIYSGCREEFLADRQAWEIMTNTGNAIMFVSIPTMLTWLKEKCIYNSAIHLA